MDEPRFLSGKLLLAMPGMADPRFERAVIAICVHDENGAVGIGIGHKRAGLRFRELLNSSTSTPAKRPTPRSTTAGRSSRAGASSSIRPTGAGRTRSTSPGQRRAVRDDRDDRRPEGDRRGPRPARWIAALGYAGWGEGQLDEEMTRHGWFARRGEPGDPVRHADRRALGGGVQGRRGSIRACCRARPAPPEAPLASPESTYKEFFIFALAALRG